MSWNAYLDNLQAQSKDSSGTFHCDKACIIGMDGGAKWTTDDHPLAMKITAQEGASVAHCMKNKTFDSFMTGGIVLEGIKYQFLRAEEDKIILGKRREYGSVTLQACKLSPSEAATIASAFKSKNWTGFQSSGIFVESQKYQFLRVEDDKTVMGKYKGKGAVTLQCSKTAVVIGHTAEGCQQGNVNKAVNVIADYLEGMNM